METNFKLLKNGKVALSVWANAATRETYTAHRNSFGHNAKMVIGDDFYKKYGREMKHNQGRHDPTRFYYSAKSMEAAGFKLILRGDAPLW